MNKVVFIYEEAKLNVKGVLLPAARELGITGRGSKNKAGLIEALMIEGIKGFVVNDAGEYVGALRHEDLDKDGLIKSRQVKRAEARKVAAQKEAKAKVDSRIESILNKTFIPTFKDLMEELNVFDQENKSNLAKEILEGISTVGVKNIRNAFIQAYRNSDLNKMLIDDFLSTRYVPTTMKMNVRKSVLVHRADLSDEKATVEEDGKLFSTLDYENFNRVGAPADEEKGLAASGLMMQAPSDFLNTIGFKTKNLKVTSTAIVKGRKVEIDYDITVPKSIAEKMMIVNFGEFNEDSKDRLVKAMKDGIYIKRDGEVLHYVYIQRSPSQARQLMGVFVLNNTTDSTGFEAVDNLLQQLGTESVIYAKFNVKEGLYVLDCTKPDKRKGLKQTTSDQIVTFQFGNKIKRVYPGTNKEVSAQDLAAGIKHDILILGGVFTLRVLAEDVYAKVKTGKYTSVNKADKAIEVLDAAEEEQTLVVGDGTSFVNSRVARIMKTETGKLSVVFQGRLMNHIKGMFVADDMIDEMYDEDFVIFPGAMKGNIIETIKKGHPLRFHCARINPESKTNKEYTLFPYQFVNIIKCMNADDLYRIVKPHLNRVKDMLEDFSIMQEYLGVDDIEAIQEKIDSFSVEEDAAEYVDRKLSTRLTKAIFYSKGKAYEDAYLKRAAFDALSLMVRKWLTGQVPVKGHYKYLLQDPKAILATLRSEYKLPGSVRKEGKLIVPENIGIRPDQSVISVHDKETGMEVPYVGDVALLRNPAVAQGEASSVTAVYDEDYAKAMAQGYYSNVTILSCHDFALVRMGGADVDGDTAFVVFETIIVNRIKEMDAPAVLDRWFVVEDGKRVFDDGCPWKPEEFQMDNEDMPIPTIPASLVTKQDGYEIKFTKEQYENIELRRYIHDLEKHWVLKTLKQNMIGQLTNVATILLDMISRLENAIAANMNIYGGKLGKKIEDFEHTAENYQALIKEFSNMVMWTRYAQGWEIDRAKHGGAYELALQEQLAFFFDKTYVVPLVTFIPEGKKNKIWNKPLWFKVQSKASRVVEARNEFNRYFNEKESRSYHVPSMLNTHLNTMINWFNSFEGEFKVMSKDFANRNIGQWLSNIAPDREAVVAIKEALKPVKNFYNSGILEIMENFRNTKAQLDQALMVSQDYHAYKIRMEIADADRKAALKNLIETATAMYKALEIHEVYAPELIGYSAYELTYANRTTVESPSFPWVIAEDELMKALAKAGEGMVKKDTELVDIKETLQFVVPKESGFSKESVIKLMGLTKHKGVKAIYNDQKEAYYLYVIHPQTGKFTAMGKFPYKSTTDHFAGHKQVDIFFSDVYGSAARKTKDGMVESITCHLSVTRMLKH